MTGGRQEQGGHLLHDGEPVLQNFAEGVYLKFMSRQSRSGVERNLLLVT